MPNVETLLKLEVPVTVRLAERKMPLAEVVNLVQGAIIELPKNAEDELDLMIGNKQVGFGTAVKVGENFGLRITYIGDVRERLEALASGDDTPEGQSDDEIAEALLAGQL